MLNPSLRRNASAHHRRFGMATSCYDAIGPAAPRSRICRTAASCSRGLRAYRSTIRRVQKRRSSGRMLTQWPSIPAGGVLIEFGSGFSLKTEILLERPPRLGAYVRRCEAATWRSLSSHRHIIAMLIIAFFYSGGLQSAGFIVASLGILMVIGLQHVGLGSALTYILPGAAVRIGFLMTGAHPTLVGVVLGLMSPVRSILLRGHPFEVVSRVLSELRSSNAVATKDTHRLDVPLRKLRVAQREILPPVVRVQTALHPWVAYGVMPLFALANAGVSLTGADPASGGAQLVMLGVGVSLVAGKPIGVVGATWLAVWLGWCRLAPGVTWSSVCLVGLLAGIGFTMSIFIAMLTFTDERLQNGAKSGVLLGSLVADMLGLGWGTACVRRLGGQWDQH